MSETHQDLAIRTAVIAGGAAGNLTVTGIVVGDVLKSVQRVDAAGANLVDEFTISAADTINNTGGTNTTGFVLHIMWIAKDARGPRLDLS